MTLENLFFKAEISNIDKPGATKALRAFVREVEERADKIDAMGRRVGICDAYKKLVREFGLKEKP